jgi:hypothetical protein
MGRCSIEAASLVQYCRISTRKRPPEKGAPDGRPKILLHAVCAWISISHRRAPPVKDAVAVPQSAVIHTGERNIVFVDLGQGRFDPRAVDLGVKGKADRIQVVNGIAAGEKVVTQAQFMLDSESRTQEAIAQYRKRPRREDRVDSKPPEPGH